MFPIYPCETLLHNILKNNRLITEEQREYCGRMMRYLEFWFGISWDRISGKYAVTTHQGRNLLNKKDMAI